MMSPKSIAPKLIRLPETWPCTMPVMAMSSDNGIASATMSAARQLPSMMSSTTTTRIAPSNKLVSTVRIVRSTSTVRSYTGMICTPAGSLV